MMVTPETPWRETGDTTVAGLIAEFRTQGDSPLVDEAARLLAAAGGMSRLMAGISFVEQKHATYQGVIPKTSHNFLSLASGWIAGAHTWESFSSYAACAARWKQLLTDPAGAYRNARTVRELINIYAPPIENDVDRYVLQAIDVINRIPLAGSSPAPAGQGGTPMPATTPTITFGNVSAPPVNRRDIDPGLNTAFDRLGPRFGLFVVLHRMYGSLWGTDEYFRNEARTKARTDYGVDQTTGEIIRWTDPLGDLSPYASGPYTAPPGDGIALVAKLGQLAINRHGISIEVGGRGNDQVSDTTFDRLVQLIAFWADYNQIPYPVWPINPKTGLAFVYWHGEFNGAKGPGTQTDCPGLVLRNRTTELIDRVRAVLRDAQAIEVSGSVLPTPQPQRPPRPTVPVTPPTAIALPAGVDLAMVSGWFGSVASNGDRAMSFGFDPTGPVTKLWLEHGRETGEWPQLASVNETAGGRLFRFDGGWTVRGSADGTVEEVVA